MITQSWLALCALTPRPAGHDRYRQTWHVYLLALLFGVGTAFDNPARQTLRPGGRRRDHLPNAIGLNSASVPRGPDRRPGGGRAGDRGRRLWLGHPRPMP